MEQNNKHSQICSVSYLPISNATIDNYPGLDYIHVSGNWINIDNSSVEFSEDQKNINDFFFVELKVVITDFTSDTSYINVPIIIRINYTNNQSKILGTYNTPIYLSLLKSGNPSTKTLNYKGTQPEAAKILRL